MLREWIKYLIECARHMLVATKLIKVDINKLKGVWYPHESHRRRTPKT